MVASALLTTTKSGNALLSLQNYEAFRLLHRVTMAGLIPSEELSVVNKMNSLILTPIKKPS
jgi:hypothetical protein